jgi:hypothetical protein
MYYYDSASSDNALRNHTLSTIYQAVKDTVLEVIKAENVDVIDANTPPTIMVIESACARWEGLYNI